MLTRSSVSLSLAVLTACTGGPEGMAVDQAPTPVAFNLEVSAIAATSPVTMIAIGLPGAGVRVSFLAGGEAGAGPCAPDGSACLDIAGPVRVLGTARSDANGVARLTIVAPPTLVEGESKGFQAIASGPGGTWVTSDVEIREIGDAGVCFDAQERPQDPTLAEWSYHGVDDGPDEWGSLAGYGLCGSGGEQAPIDVDTSATVPTSTPLQLVNYGLDIPLQLLDNGHTLQVDYLGTTGPSAPQLQHDGRTWYLRQFHVHSTSEHTFDGQAFLFEIHFVHVATDGSRAVLGVLVDVGAENEVIQALLENDPGHHMAATCTDTIPIYELLPASDTYVHYTGSLTTPPCDEGVEWFLLTETIEASEDQALEWQHEFGGETARPTQPLGIRTVVAFGP